MFRIAICDDDPFICNDLEQILEEIAKDNMPLFTIQKFVSGEELHKTIFDNSTVFDIIFLDIELGTTTGIDVGNKIRDTFRSELTQIVYISNHKKYAMDLFKVRPFDFIVKPFEPDVIKDVITKIMKIIFKQSGTFVYKIDKTEYEIELYKVLYFVNIGKKVAFKTFKDNYETNEFYGKISDIKERLLKHDFFLATGDCLVNYYAVTKFLYKKVQLINGETIDISQAYRNDVRDMHKEKRKEKMKMRENKDGADSIF